jgi:WD40 repeat protein
MTTIILQMVTRLSAFTAVLTDRAPSPGTTSSPIKHFSTDLDKSVWSAAMSPDGRIVAAGEVWSVAMSPDGRIVAAGLSGGIICVWDADTGQLMERLQGYTRWSSSIAFTPDGKGIVSSGNDDSTLKYWDISNVLRGGNAMPKEMKHARRDGEERRERVWSVAVSQDGEWIVSGHLDGGVQFWDARTRELQLVLRGHEYGGWCYILYTCLIANDSCGLLVDSIAISSQCGMVASSDNGGNVRICKYTSL